MHAHYCSLYFVSLFHRRVKFDNLNKAFCILRLPRSSDTTSTTTTATNDEEHEEPSCLVKRVDFVVSPPEQYPFALVSWTGSKVRHSIIYALILSIAYSFGSHVLRIGGIFFIGPY